MLSTFGHGIYLAGVSGNTDSAESLEWAQIKGRDSLMFRCVERGDCAVVVSLTLAPKQCDQAPRRLRLVCRRQKPSVPHAPSAAPPRNLSNSAVALAVALGSRTVEMAATHSSIIPGPRAFRLAQVGCGHTAFVRFDLETIALCKLIGFAVVVFGMVTMCL